MPKVLELSTLDPTQGFMIQGDVASDDLGFSVSAAGDVNGDGIADVIVGAPGGDDGGNLAGEAYVIFGRDVAGGANPFGTIDVSALDPADGFIIQGAAAGDQAGTAVSGAGDVNGDGIDDLIVGAPYHADGSSQDHGMAYVIFGRDVAGGAAAFGTIDLAALDPADGFSILGSTASAYAGMSVSSAGDINGDGISDILIGAPNDSLNGPGTGAAFVIYGRDVAGGAAAFGNYDLGALAQDVGFGLLGTTSGDSTGYSVSAAGDVNGDGIDDLIIGVPDSAGRTGNHSGGAWVVFGRDVPGGATPFQTGALDSLAASDGFFISGHGSAGFSVSGAGDMNGDGIDDVILGAITTWLTGEVFVVFGRDRAGGAAAASDITLFPFDTTVAFRILGEDEDDEFGWSVAAAGDVNGDGNDDVIVTGYLSRDAFVIYGRDVADGDPMFTAIDAANIDPADGFIIRASTSERGGISVSAAGDVNGDGYDDLIVGAHYGDAGGNSAGQAYVIYGLPERLELRGSDAADRLTGDANDDELRGGGGDDVLKGGRGDDVLGGGLGDDRLSGNAGNDRLIGGLGNDTLSGNDGDDVLFGRDGRDWLRGGAGADTLDGGAGRDRLKGGAGPDLLRGGAGNDRFIFGAVDESPAGAGDTISDFGNGDRIHLGRIDADTASPGRNEAFTWIAEGAFTGTAGELRYRVTATGAIVRGDVDGDGAADLEITLRGVTALTEADFLL